MFFEPVMWKNVLYVAGTQQKLTAKYMLYKDLLIKRNPCLKGLSVHGQAVSSQREILLQSLLLLAPK